MLAGFLASSGSASVSDIAPRRILVIEDEVLVRHVVADALRDDGWQVLESASGEGAIAVLRNGPPVDLIFTDIQLAGPLSGWDVAEAFRGAHPGMPVVYTSGNSVDRRRAVDGSLFFDKPYAPETVLQTCRTLMEC
jgi:two-component system OmpR family response regulator